MIVMHNFEPNQIQAISASQLNALDPNVIASRTFWRSKKRRWVNQLSGTQVANLEPRLFVAFFDCSTGFTEAQIPFITLQHLAHISTLTPSRAFDYVNCIIFHIRNNGLVPSPQKEYVLALYDREDLKGFREVSAELQSKTHQDDVQDNEQSTDLN